MAQVDFSHAVLDVNTNAKPLDSANYLNLNFAELRDSSGNQMNQTGNVSILSNTPAKVSILFTGTFYSGSSGTEFYIGTQVNRFWKVSNISFSGGDSYSFIIDIETSGNT